jgi:hypothetical protein
MEQQVPSTCWPGYATDSDASISLTPLAIILTA